MRYYHIYIQIEEEEEDEEDEEEDENEKEDEEEDENGIHNTLSSHPSAFTFETLAFLLGIRLSL